MSTVTAPKVRRGPEGPTTVRPIAVMISVKHDESGHPTGYDVTCDSTDGHPHIVWKNGKHVNDPDKFHVVQWEALGLRSETVTIIPAPGAKEFFKWKERILSPTEPKNSSDLAHLAPANNKAESWNYKVILKWRDGQKRKWSLTLDPIIIIEE